MNKTIRWVNETKRCGIQREFGHIFRTSSQFLPHFKPVSSALQASFFRTSNQFLPHFKPISSALQNLFRPAYKVASAILAVCLWLVLCRLLAFFSVMTAQEYGKSNFWTAIRRKMMAISAILDDYLQHPFRQLLPVEVYRQFPAPLLAFGIKRIIGQ